MGILIQSAGPAGEQPLICCWAENHVISPTNSCYPKKGSEAGTGEAQVEEPEQPPQQKPLPIFPLAGQSCTFPFLLWLRHQSRAHSVLPSRCTRSGLGDSQSLARRACLLKLGPGNPKEHSKESPVQTLMERFTWKKTTGIKECWPFMR